MHGHDYVQRKGEELRSLLGIDAEVIIVNDSLESFFDTTTEGALLLDGAEIPFRACPGAVYVDPANLTEALHAKAQAAGWCDKAKFDACEQELIAWLTVG